MGLGLKWDECSLGMGHGTCGGWYEAGSEVAGNEIRYLSMLCHQALDCG